MVGKSGVQTISQSKEDELLRLKQPLRTRLTR